MSKRVRRVALAAAAVFVLAAAPIHAAGTTWYVAPAGSDANSCAAATAPCLTIDGAIGKASAGDTVDVAVGTYTGSGANVVAIDKDLTLSGGWNVTFTQQTGLSTIDGQNVQRGVFVASTATATVTRFEVKNGAPPPGPDPFAQGGGILAGGPLTLDQSYVHGNAADGVETTGAPLTITNSTVAGNQSGVALYNLTGNYTITITNSTIANNTDSGINLAILGGSSSSSLTLNFDTITANSSTDVNGGGGISAYSGWNIELDNTIVSANTAPYSPDISVGPSSSVTSGGYNIGSGFPHTGTDTYGDPVLASLADNGGPTPTMDPLSGSPALDTIPLGVNACGTTPATDQRGQPRPGTTFDACDVGSVEVQPPANDAFASATVLAAGAGTLATTNLEATKEHGEPNHAGDTGGASIWFAWTPSFTGTASIDTAGSDFDTLLAVYTGHSVSALARLASNDDIEAAGGASRVCFPVTAATTYYIAVDGYAGDTGIVDLSWGSQMDTGPCPTLPPTVTGTLLAGHVLTAAAGTWTGAALSFTHQWYRCAAKVCSSIPDATGKSYTLQPRDVGTDLRVDEVASDGTNQAVSSSDPTDVIGMATSPGANGRIFWTTNRRSNSDFDIYAANPDGSSTVPIRATAAFETEPAPSPDGSKIAYADLSANRLVIAASDGSNPTPLNVGGAFPVWSPDGSRLAFVHFQNGNIDDGELEIANVTTGLLVVVPVDGVVYNVDWSPDGTKLALSVKPTGDSNFHIAVMNADGSGGLHVLTSATTDDQDPSWSPDGTKIAFARSPVAGGITDGDIYAVDADGTNERLLYDGSAPNDVALYPDFSPDGTKIVFSTGVSELYVMSANGGNPTQITFDPSRNEIPKWSVSYTPPPSGGGGGGGGGGSGGGAGSVPDLVLTWSARLAQVDVGGVDDITAQITNKGGAGSLQTHLRFTLPPSLQLVGPPTYEVGSGCTGAQAVDCFLDYIANGATTKVVFQVRAVQAGAASITGTLSADREANPADNTATLSLQVGASTSVPPPAPPTLKQVRPRMLQGVHHTKTETVDSQFLANEAMTLSMFFTRLGATQHKQLQRRTLLAGNLAVTPRRSLGASLPTAGRYRLHLVASRLSLVPGKTYVVHLVGTNADGKRTTLLIRFRA